jgi:peptidoglycan/xylan/chitin deacetylase (PgdA/CDA1 family)
VSTTAPIEIEFDRPLADNPQDLVTITPAVLFWPRWQGRKLILEHERLRAGSPYRVILSPGIRDSAGHPSQERYSFVFATVKPPTVVSAEPAGNSIQHVFSEVKVVFDQAMDQTSVEQSFRVEPQASGSFGWLDDKTLVWKPWALLYSTTYRISVGGASRVGDPLAQDYSWQFRTQDAPPPMITSSGDGTIVLTFDDQGSKAQVEAILDILAENLVKAVFFPVGKWAEQNRELIDRMKAEGHLVGNHTYSHANLTKLSEQEVRWEIEHGAGRDLLRLPYGASNAVVESVAADLGYSIYGWNVDSEDWKGVTAQEIVETVIREVKPGSVIVLHLQGKNTAEAVKHLIPLLRQMGYKFWRPEGSSS